MTYPHLMEVLGMEGGVAKHFAIDFPGAKKTIKFLSARIGAQ